MKKKIILAVLAGSALFAIPAFAEGERYAPVNHEATLKECSACHMVFQPQMLPARSWEAIINGLDDHFGENAALDPKVADDIKAFLMANAADAPGVKSRWARGLDAADTPLRISETPRFARAHREVSAAVFSRKDIGSKANCIACHTGADKGLYTEPGEGFGDD
jgi:hypothetical protein